MANLDEMTEEERRRALARRARRRKKRRQRKIRRLIALGVCLLALILIIVLAVSAVRSNIRKKKAAKQAAIEESESIAREEVRKAEEKQEITEEAAYIAAGYDYEGAIQLLQSIDGYEEDADITALIDEYTADNDAMVPVDMDQITHIFYHSLVVNTDLAFTGTGADGFKEWMTTTYEFDQITQQMYDKGYVLISLYDMVEEEVQADGTVKMVQKQLYLPEGKIPYVLSLDDLSYYHSYDGHGIATKLVLDEDGKPTCEYIDENGTVLYGDYDCVPRLDAFLEEHPDGAYHGARGTIALTGYDGILGYRTDIAYKTLENLDTDQKVWLEAHPNFDYEEECLEAKKVADALKADGWTFASHTWGHIHIGDVSLERLQTDTTKWKSYVEPLVGETDIIIFAHGQDMTGVGDYTSSNEKYAYLKSQGYNIFCNVDSAQYFLQYRDDYLRMGRRNLDGYRLWEAVHGSRNRISDLVDDPSTVLDPARTDMPEL